MPVLVTDNIQLKIQLSQLRDLLIEELILPCTWRQIGQTDPKQTHSISTATSLPEQIQRFPKEDLIHIQWSVPVSYTHLRAHETDSYLVCRLLLEKKKQKKTKK